MSRRSLIPLWNSQQLTPVTSEVHWALLMALLERVHVVSLFVSGVIVVANCLKCPRSHTEPSRVSVPRTERVTSSSTLTMTAREIAEGRC